MRLILLFAIVIVFISSLPGGQAEDVAEATKSLPKEAGLLGLDGPLDQLDLTKMLAESFDAKAEGCLQDNERSVCGGEIFFHQADLANPDITESNHIRGENNARQQFHCN